MLCLMGCYDAKIWIFWSANLASLIQRADRSIQLRVPSRLCRLQLNSLSNKYSTFFCASNNFPTLQLHLFQEVRQVPHYNHLVLVLTWALLLTKNTIGWTLHGSIAPLSLCGQTIPNSSCPLRALPFPVWVLTLWAWLPLRWPGEKQNEVYIKSLNKTGVEVHFRKHFNWWSITLRWALQLQ